MKLQGEAKPATFTGPDQQLVAQVKRVLKTSGYVPLSQVRVLAERGEVCLEGEVPTYFMKQLAQTHVLPIEGVRRLKNDISVERQYNHFK